MRMLKFSCFAVFTALLTSAFMPSLSAKTFTSFSLNLNLDPRPRYVERHYVQPVPAYTVVRPYRPAVVEKHVYYSTPQYREVIVNQPAVERVYVHPHYSYWGY